MQGGEGQSSRRKRTKALTAYNSIAHLPLKMKKIKFYQMFLLFSWIVFIAFKGDIYSAILLMCASAYAICEILSKFKNKKGD